MSRPDAVLRALITASSRTLLRPFSTGVALSVLLVMVASAPLYLMGYDRGASPLTGWILSFALGGIAAAGVLCLQAADMIDPTRRYPLIQIDMRWSMGVALVVGTPLALYVWVVSRMEVVQGYPAISSWITNQSAWSWKPIAHVCVMATAVICVAYRPFIYEIGRGVTVNRILTNEINLSRWRLVISMYVLMVIAFIPVIGLLSVTAAARMILNLAYIAMPIPPHEK